MQRVILAALLALALGACQTAPKAPEPAPKPAPVIAPKPPTEPFIALLEARKDPRAFDLNGDDRVTRPVFKDHFLHAFSAADRLDGSQDGSVPIAESCKELLALCKSADVNHDGKLSLKEFLDKLDELFDKADRRHRGFLSHRELVSLGESD
jgi:hypothetical protein